MSRERMTLFRSYGSVLRRMTDLAKFRELTLAIIDYGLDDKEPEFSDESLLCIFEALRPNLDNSKSVSERRKQNRTNDNKTEQTKTKRNKTEQTKTKRAEVEVEEEVEVEDENVLEAHKRKRAPRFENPELEKAWCNFVEMRKKSRKPMTDRAKDLMDKKLRKLAADQFGELNEDKAIEILEKSTLNAWSDIYEPHSKGIDWSNV